MCFVHTPISNSPSLQLVKSVHKHKSTPQPHDCGPALHQQGCTCLLSLIHTSSAEANEILLCFTSSTELKLQLWAATNPKFSCYNKHRCEFGISPLFTIEIGLKGQLIHSLGMSYTPSQGFSLATPLQHLVCHLCLLPADFPVCYWFML